MGASDQTRGEIPNFLILKVPKIFQFQVFQFLQKPPQDSQALFHCGGLRTIFKDPQTILKQIFSLLSWGLHHVRQQLLPVIYKGSSASTHFHIFEQQACPSEAWASKTYCTALLVTLGLRIWFSECPGGHMPHFIIHTQDTVLTAIELPQGGVCRDI